MLNFIIQCAYSIHYYIDVKYNYLYQLEVLHTDKICVNE